MSVADRCDAAVIGGGLFGCVLAIHLKERHGGRIALIEQHARLLQRASSTNQARVHRGYHYPRSLSTAHRSHINFPRFVDAFRECIVDDFVAVYAVAPRFSSVTAAQFRLFCDRLGAPVEPADDDVRGLFDPDRVEQVFRVQECVFDARRLAERLRSRLEAVGVDLPEIALVTVPEALRPASEIDDRRPILHLEHHGIRNLTRILGAKIDNVFDMIDLLASARVP